MQSTKLVGKDLFYKRIEKKMKQEELCQGICSVSYLSKIENDKIIPSQEILQLLCERLGIEIDSVKDIEGDVANKLDEWRLALVDADRETAKEIHADLKEKIARVTDFEILNYYNVLRFRYLVLAREILQAEAMEEDLKKFLVKYSPSHKMIYTYVSGLLHCLKGEWEEAVQSLTEAERIAKEIKYFEAGMYYNLALAQSQVQNVYKALYFAQIAMDSFRNECRYRRMIDCQVIMAINYARLGEYERALQMYENILQAAKSFADPEGIYALVYHNMGHAHRHKRDARKAIQWYLKSLQHKKKSTNTYLITLHELVEQYLHLNMLAEAKVWIEEGLQSVEGKDVEKKWQYLFQMFYYKHFSEPQKYKKFLEKEALPFFKSHRKWNELKNVYLELAEYFEKILEYRESTRYYKKAVQILEGEKEGI